MTKRRRDTIIYSGIIVGCLIFLFWVIPANTPEYPGYGMPAYLLPNIAVSIMLVLSGIELIRLFMTYRAEKKKGIKTDQKIAPQEQVRLGHLLRFMIPCILLMPAIEWIGFIPASLLFMLVIQYLCGQRKPMTIILVTIVTVGIIYSAMRYGLEVPFP
ncbi:MAG: tripartite tricarboxylate transporter TctB family protein [Desulfonatronovibrionaceae bacterium]